MSELLQAPPISDYGRLVATRAVALQVPGAAVAAALDRFYAMDWGAIDNEDAAVNRESITRRDGANVHGVYPQPDGEDLWIICAGFGNDPSDPDACYTTVLFPSDY